VNLITLTRSKAKGIEGPIQPICRVASQAELAPRSSQTKWMLAQDYLPP
jgi:hypothetical protein